MACHFSEIERFKLLGEARDRSMASIVKGMALQSRKLYGTAKDSSGAALRHREETAMLYAEAFDKLYSSFRERNAPCFPVLGVWQADEASGQVDILCINAKDFTLAHGGFDGQQEGHGDAVPVCFDFSVKAKGI